MKKCRYCDQKKKISKYRTPDNFFGRCEYCTQKMRFAEERANRVLAEKRYALVEEMA